MSDKLRDKWGRYPIFAPHLSDVAPEESSGVFQGCLRDDCNYPVLRVGETCPCGKYECLEIEIKGYNEMGTKLYYNKRPAIETTQRGAIFYPRVLPWYKVPGWWLVWCYQASKAWLKSWWRTLTHK